MNLLNHSSNFTKVSDVTIPSIFYNRIKTGIAEMDEMYGEGILPASATTLTAQAGCGKCHGPNEIIEIFGSDDIINKFQTWLAAKAGK